MEQQAQAPELGTIKLYACGGAGINIGSNFENYRSHVEAGMATIDVVYFDSSNSNLKPSLPQDKIYKLPKTDASGKEPDGAGKERKHLSAAMLKHAKDMLQKHKPGYLNVVLSSASGGTGAPMAAAVINELLAQDELVVAITVGVLDSGTEIKNTLATFKTFEGLVAANKKSIAVAYFENNKDTPPSEVDTEINDLVVALSVLFSRQNEGLDTRDMYNFLNFDRMTAFKTHAAGLQTFVGKLDAEEHKDTITVASAVVNKDARGIDFVIPYTCYGVMPSAIEKEVTERAPLHLVTKAYPFNDISARLKGILADMEKAAAAYTTQSEVLDGDEQLVGGFLAE
jgi:hypothetical protein